jgi:hypothetical protein
MSHIITLATKISREENQWLEFIRQSSLANFRPKTEKAKASGGIQRSPGGFVSVPIPIPLPLFNNDFL